MSRATFQFDRMMSAKYPFLTTLFARSDAAPFPPIWPCTTHATHATELAARQRGQGLVEKVRLRPLQTLEEARLPIASVCGDCSYSLCEMHTALPARKLRYKSKRHVLKASDAYLKSRMFA